VLWSLNRISEVECLGVPHNNVLNCRWYSMNIQEAIYCFLPLFPSKCHLGCLYRLWLLDPVCLGHILYIYMMCVYMCRCFIMEDRGYLVAHPTLIDPKGHAPAEQQHITHKVGNC